MFKIITIDDEPYVTQLFSALLDWESLGFEVVNTFNSAKDALIWLENNTCDVIFTDIVIPDLTGIEFAEICNNKFPDILIVFFSAHRDFDYALHAIRHNVFDYLIKPLSSSALNTVVARLKNTLEEKVASSPDSKKTLDFDDTELVRLARQFISEHYHEDISAADVANHVGLSTNYFSTLFKQESKESFVSALKNKRLEKAKELLENKDIKISIIPYQIGFKSYSYFTKIFQDTFGKTPTDYRNDFFKIKKNGDKR